MAAVAICANMIYIANPCCEKSDFKSAFAYKLALKHIALLGVALLLLTKGKILREEDRLNCCGRRKSKMS